MDTIHFSDWLNFALILWVLISLFVAPLVGRFVAGALRERTSDRERRTAETRTLGAGEAPQTTPFPHLQAGQM